VFRVCAAQLRAACADRGLHLLEGTAEALLAQRIRLVAEAMNISDREILDHYIAEGGIDSLVDVLADGAARLHDVIDAASPVMLHVREAARITAALGQLACWAGANYAKDPWHAAALMESAGTAVTMWALAIEQAGSDGVTLVSADNAVRTRHALAAFVSKLGAGTWTTPLALGEHPSGLQDAIARDLALLA